MPIQQHPLPQDISSYRFRLIGDMTIKQFLYLASFVILTILINKMPLPFFFRYPLEIVSLGLGIGLAFVPIQGRPLDKWIIAFIKSIYSPTQYTWQQSKDEPLKTAFQKTAPSPSRTSVKQTRQKTKIAVSNNLPINNTPSVATQKTSSTAPAPLPPQKTKVTTNKPSPINKIPSKTFHSPINKPPAKTTTIFSGKIPSPNPTSIKKATAGPPTANLPIPFTPEQPNTIVGLTLNPQGLILDGVLIEIISNGLTIRATKSNKLGQFLFAKALENGLYQLKAEKEGYSFTVYSLKLKGDIVKPLKIQAK